MMSNPIHTPKTLKELDTIADQFAQSMADVFDFRIGEKKRNKLREATCRALGHPNGLQSLMPAFKEREAIMATPLPDNMPDQMVVVGQGLMDLTIYLKEADLCLLRSGVDIEFKDPAYKDRESELCVWFSDWDEAADEDDLRRLDEAFNLSDYGIAAHDFLNVLAAHYEVVQVAVEMPNVDEYGVSSMGVWSSLGECLEEFYGLSCSETMEPEDLYTMDLGDDSGEQHTIVLKKRTQEGPEREPGGPGS